MTATARTGRVWFVTTAGHGTGRAVTAAALARGERVAAVVPDEAARERLLARHDEHRRRLFVRALDVTDNWSVNATVCAAADRFGRLDAIVNDARPPRRSPGTEDAAAPVGWIPQAAARARMESAFFGPLWVAQAVLPLLYEQRSGHLLQLCGSVGPPGAPGAALDRAGTCAVVALSRAAACEAARVGVDISVVGGRPDAGALLRLVDGAAARRREATGPVSAPASASASAAGHGAAA
ncbi:SDR family NAD(P)-dependent oxidoreductase [Streptomyces sp. NBC_01808]|uniref:SDR family NAD(P)-dependent oxidoreductase n=1 Tax=Streptomyces sp. NBC_01808 TaxID=2975947 RepID=UPI002DDBEC2D|nr:SDR family NAD(P)-dependent oxidoreductase [Streptomyces sp. NBC_01808]WSA42281.1 SDR family NAD(P)-dependent oxidoreductase [Streptomyces sp. NBC_01808]